MWEGVNIRFYGVAPYHIPMVPGGRQRRGPAASPICRMPASNSSAEEAVLWSKGVPLLI